LSESNPDHKVELSADISEAHSGQRLDKVAAELFPDYSRAVLQGWIKSGDLLVNEKPAKPKDKVYFGARLQLTAVLESHDEWLAEDIPLDIVYEDEALLVVNKPADWVVHPAAGNPTGTMMNAILFHHPEARSLPRAGIVHRLDKDTTGLMVVAKTLPAHHSLVGQLQARTVKRDYVALVHGEMTGGGKVNEPIGRHPHHRTKMAVEPLHGKEAVTHYRIRQRFDGFTLLDVSLETGRTHQIRVHLAHLKYPIVGDSVYGGRSKIPREASDDLLQALQHFPRQALHARKLTLEHPVSGEVMEWKANMPEDMDELLAVLPVGQRQV